MDLYIVHTPYHLTLSVINGCMRNETLIVMLDMTGTLGWYSSPTVSSLFNNNFFYINLGGRSGFAKFLDKNYFISKFISLGVVGTVHKKVTRKNVERIYVFNDSFHEVQGILNSFPRSKVSYFEDGSAPYNSHKVKNRFPKWFSRLIFSFKFCPVNVLGTSHYIDDCIFTRPELARLEHKRWPIRALEIKEESDVDLENFLTLFELSFLDKYEDQKSVSLYLLPVKLNKHLLDYYKKLWSLDHGLKLIKKHPISKEAFDIPGDFLELDSSMPAEAVVLKFKNLTAIFGYPSTTLFFSKFVRPDLNVYCVLSGSDIDGDRFSQNMERSGVSLMRDSSRG